MGLLVVLGLGIEGERLNGSVGHQVLVVEEQAVQTQAVGELEAVGGVPLVLGVDAGFMELHTGGRSLFTVVTIGEVYNLRGGVEQGSGVQGAVGVVHIVREVETVVTGTVTHVLVVGHLILIAEAGSEFVGTQVPGEVILHVGDGVVHGVVPGEKFITQGHVVVIVLGDVDEGELGGVGAADIIQLGEGEQELVGHVVREAAVQVQGPGAHQVLHGVHGVGEGHGVVRHTGVAHTGTAVHGGSVRGAPVLVLRVVVTQGQVMVVGDVPVQTGQDLDIVLVGGEIRVGAGVVTVSISHIVLYRLEVCQLGTGQVFVGITHTILGAFPTVHHRRNLDILEVHEEEEFVLDDGTAEGHTVRGAAVLVAGTGDLLTVYGVTLHVLVLMIHISGTLEGVGTGLGDGVHAAADEVGLADIVGADYHLHFLDGVDGDGVAATREVGVKTEVVVEVGTVHGEVGGTAVGAGEAHAVTTVRRQAGNVGDAAADGGKRGDLVAADVGYSTGTLLRIELGGSVCDNHSALQHFRALCNLGVQGEGFCQLEGDTGVGGILVTQAGEIHLVRTAGTHTLNGITTVCIGHGAVNGTGGLVLSHNSSADNRLAVLVYHATGEGGRGHLSIGDSARNQRSECEQ